MEPRARAARHKGQLNFGDEITAMLFAHGDVSNPAGALYRNQPRTPYPETVRVLDELLTDYIIEICHSAVSVASHAGRQKLKGDDFQFVLRKDPAKLGRVHHMYMLQKATKQARKGIDELMGGGGGDAGKLDLETLDTLGHMGGEEGTGKGKGRGRGRKRKERPEEEGDAPGEKIEKGKGGAKKVKGNREGEAG